MKSSLVAFVVVGAGRGAPHSPRMSRRRKDQRAVSDLGPRVRRLRELQGQTQEKLAELAGVSVFSVSRIEGGSGADVDTICRIAAALGVAPGVLIDPEGSTSVAPHEAAMLAGLRELPPHQQEAIMRLVAGLRSPL